jgi:hypothetical protein
MAYENLVTGTIRLDRQAYLTNTSSAMRIYEVFFITSLPNAVLYITDNAPTTTATSTTNEKLRIPAVDSGTGFWVGQYTSAIGTLFTSSALIHTSTAFGYATINYCTEAK